MATVSKNGQESGDALPRCLTLCGKDEEMDMFRHEDERVELELKFL
jgi:hypothetical protein